MYIDRDDFSDIFTYMLLTMTTFFLFFFFFWGGGEGGGKATTSRTLSIEPCERKPTGKIKNRPLPGSYLSAKEKMISLLWSLFSGNLVNQRKRRGNESTKEKNRKTDAGLKHRHNFMLLDHDACLLSRMLWFS